MATAFKPEDVVQLVSGGPRMTITQIGSETPVDQKVWCVWSKGGKKKEDAFSVSALTLVPDDPPAHRRN